MKVVGAVAASVLCVLGCDPVETVGIESMPSPSATDGRGVATGFATAKGPQLLVALGSCDGCVRDPYQPGSESKAYRRVVLLYWPDGSGRKPTAYQNLGPRYKLVVDEVGALHKKLAAFPAPRLYALDAAGVVQLADGGPDRRAAVLKREGEP